MKHRRPTGLRLVGVIIPRGQRAKWVLVAFMGVAVAMAESIAAVLTALLVDTMSRGNSGDSIELPLIGDVSRLLPGEGMGEQLQYLAVAMAVFFLAKGFLVVARAYVQARVAQNTGARLASRLFEGYLSMPYDFHISRNSAELIRNSSWAADEVVSTYLNPIANILTQSAMLLFLLGVLIAAAPVVTLVTIGTLVPLTFVVLKVVRPTLNRLGRVTKKKVRESLESLQQSLHGVRDVKVLGRERFFGTEFRHARRELARSKYVSSALGQVPSLTIETVLVIVLLVLIGLFSGENGLGTASLPMLGLFAYAGLRMMPAMSSIVSAVNKIQYGEAVAGTVVSELRNIDYASTRPPRKDAEPMDFEDRIELKHLGFAYEQGRYVLSDINAVIRKGESIGIVGETGAGKSTLLDLILGLLEPTIGSVRIDGVNVHENVRGWHANIGLVPQTIYLLDDTIRRNVAYGLPDTSVDEDSIEEAVKLAQLDEFVATLPKGLDTVVGERGVKLSGGQRQRVAIARALYRQPKVLIFDEGTASLDNVTEAELLKAIDGLREDHTIITVAHRLTTVKGCDQILLLDSGRLIDQGTYDELERRSDFFREMIR